MSTQGPPLPSPIPAPHPPAPPFAGAPYQYAGLGTRFVAAVIDLILLAVAAVLISLPLAALSLITFVATGGTWYVGFLFGPYVLLLFVLFVFYYSYFEGTSGQTIGKRALNVKVVEIATGRPPRMGRALVRSLLRIVDWLPTLYLLGFLVALLTPRKQRLGDLLAETVVIRV